MRNTNNKNQGTVVLLVVDGWGIAAAGEGNAIAKASTPNFIELAAKYPATILTTFKNSFNKSKINVADNYLIMGTGKARLSKSNLSLFDYFHQAGIKWLSIAEPEKIAYASFFINNKKKVKADNLAIVSSEPEDSSDATPAASINILAKELLKAIKGRKYDFIAAVIGDLDLAAHRGNFSAAISAMEAVDQNLDSIVNAVLDQAGVLLITASHGNAEEAIEMKTELNNRKDTANPVPLIIIGSEFEGKSLGFPEAPAGDLSLVPPAGSLLDVLPTILKIMGIEKDVKALDGRSLI